MGVGAEIGAAVVLGNEATENRSGRLSKDRRYSQCRWQHLINTCRTANGYDINGFGQLKDGRGNICPVTIIMPTLAMEAKEAALKNSEPFEEDLERF